MRLLDLIAGAATFGQLAIALFFLRFWRSSRDPLFASFAAAFTLLALGSGLLAVSSAPVEERTWLYLFRLAAFSLIVVAIVRKNAR